MCWLLRSGTRDNPTETSPLRAIGDNQHTGCFPRVPCRYVIYTGDRRLLSFYIEQSSPSCRDQKYTISYFDEFLLGTVAFCSSKLALKLIAACILIASATTLIISSILVSKDHSTQADHIYMLLFSLLSCFCCAPASMWTLLKPGSTESFWATNPAIVNWILNPLKLADEPEKSFP